LAEARCSAYCYRSYWGVVEYRYEATCVLPMSRDAIVLHPSVFDARCLRSRRIESCASRPARRIDVPPPRRRARPGQAQFAGGRAAPLLVAFCRRLIEGTGSPPPGRSRRRHAMLGVAAPCVLICASGFASRSDAVREKEAAAGAGAAATRHNAQCEKCGTGSAQAQAAGSKRRGEQHEINSGPAIWNGWQWEGMGGETPASSSSRRRLFAGQDVYTAHAPSSDHINISTLVLLPTVSPPVSLTTHTASASSTPTVATPISQPHNGLHVACHANEFCIRVRAQCAK